MKPVRRLFSIDYRKGSFSLVNVCYRTQEVPQQAEKYKKYSILKKQNNQIKQPKKKANKTPHYYENSPNF